MCACVGEIEDMHRRAADVHVPRQDDDLLTWCCNHRRVELRARRDGQRHRSGARFTGRARGGWHDLAATLRAVRTWNATKICGLCAMGKTERGEWHLSDTL